jgi:hydrogenase/urease accessory protein HupE
MNASLESFGHHFNAFLSNRMVSWEALLTTYLLLLIGAVSTHAHPVAQGALDLRVMEGQIELQARVSTEEVFVASATSSSASTRNESLNAVWQAYGEYLLSHLHLKVDDHATIGRMLTVVPPDGSTPGMNERVVYGFVYSLGTAGPYPRRVKLEEDVLKEFSYAPGTPWTASYVVRIDQPGAVAPREGLLLDRNQNLEFELSDATTRSQVENAGQAPIINQGLIAEEYIIHGLFHILTGYDHMLFMGALALAAVTLWDLVKVVSVFTVSHSITLTLSVLNIVRLPGYVVEPMIAGSILFVALQNVIMPTATRGWARLLTAFFFGLFHGLGFAGGLLDAMAGLPMTAIATAIIAFSIGVELGQQCVVIPVFGILKIIDRQSRNSRAKGGLRFLTERYGSVVIAVAGGYYLLEALR